MKRVTWGAMILGILTAATATAQHAQIGVGAGSMLPSGNYSSMDHAGWQLMGAVEVTFPRAPVGLRVDAMYGQTHHRGPFSVGSTKLNGGTANLVYHIGAPMVPLRLYLLAGVGYYIVDLSHGSKSNPAFAGGTGLSVRAGPWRLFVEGRFISVRTSGTAVDFLNAVNFFPVTAGLSVGL